MKATRGEVSRLIPVCKHSPNIHGLDSQVQCSINSVSRYSQIRRSVFHGDLKDSDTLYVLSVETRLFTLSAS